jgi:hypothetical protein
MNKMRHDSDRQTARFGDVVKDMTWILNRLFVAIFLMATLAARAILMAATPTTTPTPGPDAVITQLETSVIAGEGVNVNALSSTIQTGTVLTTTYKWDFGKPCGQYNVLPGWNAGH